MYLSHASTSLYIPYFFFFFFNVCGDDLILSTLQISLQFVYKWYVLQSGLDPSVQTSIEFLGEGARPVAHLARAEEAGPSLGGSVGQMVVSVPHLFK